MGPGAAGRRRGERRGEHLVARGAVGLQDVAHGGGDEAGEDRSDEPVARAGQMEVVDDGGGPGHGDAVAVRPAPRVRPVEVCGDRDDRTGPGKLPLDPEVLPVLGGRQLGDVRGAVVVDAVDAGGQVDASQGEDEALERDRLGGVPPVLPVPAQGLAQGRQPFGEEQAVGAVGQGGGAVFPEFASPIILLQALTICLNLDFSFTIFA